MQDMSKEYLKLVFDAKKTLLDIEDHKMHIADLALKACTIKLGGHLKGFYSITNFAKDIEVNRKTLSSWIHNRKIQKELEKKEIKVEDETELNNIRIIMRGDNKSGKRNTNKYSNGSAVLSAYEKNNRIGPEDQRVKNMIVNLNTIKFRLSSYILPNIDQDSLETTHLLIKDIDKMLKKHFSRSIPKTKRRSKQKVVH